MSEARNRFGHLGFTPFEGKDPNSGKDFYTIEYKADTGYGVSVTLYGSNDLVQNIVVTPDIPEPKEGSPRAWIAYSPETLIARFGSPSRVEFAVGLGPNIGINMITYYGASDLIVLYSGYNMTPERFCPLTVPFDHVELWMGQNAPDTPSFATVSLEKATSLTIDEFAQLMRESPEQACFTLKTEVFR